MNTTANMTHTPEPWAMDTGANGDVLVTSPHNPEGPDDDVAHVYGGNDADPERAQADAKRIVACVNVCAGIPDPSKLARVISLLTAVRDAMYAWEYGENDETLADIILARRLDGSVLAEALEDIGVERP